MKASILKTMKSRGCKIAFSAAVAISLLVYTLSTKRYLAFCDSALNFYNARPSLFEKPGSYHQSMISQSVENDVVKNYTNLDSSAVRSSSDLKESLKPLSPRSPAKPVKQTFFEQDAHSTTLRPLMSEKISNKMLEKTTAAMKTNISQPSNITEVSILHRRHNHLKHNRNHPKHNHPKHDHNHPKADAVLPLGAINQEALRRIFHIEANDIDLKLSLEQSKRIKQIKNTCQDQKFLNDSIHINHNEDVNAYFFSGRYAFAYCDVPKAGSTFWVQAFKVLKFGNGHGIFSKSRKEVHYQSRQFREDINVIIYNQIKTVLVSRDPYSRLYSAYVDKSFLFMNMSINIEIRKMFPKQENDTCPTDVTFQEFLEYVLESAAAGEEVNKHWAPVYNLCHPCDVNTYILVKQESFSDDVEYALRTFGVEADKLSILLKVLKDRRTKTTVPGIIDTSILYTYKYPCIDTYILVERLWESFQIQGFLSKLEPFPAEEFNTTEKLSSQNIKSVVMDYISRNPLTPEQTKEQRTAAMVDAYQNIKYGTLKGIQKLFEIDFKMFGYSLEPPSM